MDFTTINTYFSLFKAIVLIVSLGFLPGCLLCQAIALKENRILWSHAFSMLVLALSFSILSQLNIDFTQYLSIVIALVSVLVSITVWHYKYKGSSFLIAERSSNNKPLLVISLLVIAYLLIAGTYDLVPSDILRHMERVQFAAHDIASLQVNDINFHNGISDHYHYYFYATIMLFSGLNIHAVFWIASAINSILLLWALYQFTHYQHPSNQQGKFIKNFTTFFIFLSLLLFVLTKGIAGFSFIRYYSFAPTLFSFAVFLTLIIQIDKACKHGFSLSQAACIFLGLAMLLFWHIQELLFVMVFVVLLITYYTLQAFKTSNNSYYSVKIWFSASLAIVIVISVAIYFIRSQFDAPTAYTARILPIAEIFKLILPTSVNVPSFIKNANILNPFIQFSQVLGFWGILVYLCALLNLKALWQKPVLICGLVIPFVTVFNPLFVDLFLRIRGEEVLYRLLYAMPMSVIAAFIIIKSLENITLSENSQSSTVYKKIVAIFCIATLTLGLIPFKSSTRLTQYNRIADILPVEENQSLGHWQDLSESIRTLPRHEDILTDPLTGYIITATSHNIAKRYKFTQSQHLNLNQLDFSKNPFAKHQGKLLVINQRNGGSSPHGVLSTHWPEDILKTKDYYSQKLLNHLEQNPNNFELIWQKNLIFIYRIK